MDKMTSGGFWTHFWGAIGYIVAAIFTLGIGMVVRGGSLPLEWQKMAILCLLMVAAILGFLYFTIRRGRETHHDYWKYNRRSREDMGPGEQKCGQFSVIFTITAWMIYADMFILPNPFLAKMAIKCLPLFLKP
jgi:Na+/melibiose symporter-like transporter